MDEWRVWKGSILVKNYKNLKRDDYSYKITKKEVMRIQI